MNFLESIKWKQLMFDVGKGLNHGVIVVERGAMVVRRKAGDLSEEGNLHYRLLALKVKVHKDLSALGARVYSLLVTKDKKSRARRKSIGHYCSN